jgi:hypothetical protein
VISVLAGVEDVGDDAESGVGDLDPDGGLPVGGVPPHRPDHKAELVASKHGRGEMLPLARGQSWMAASRVNL